MNLFYLAKLERILSGKINSINIKLNLFFDLYKMFSIAI